VLCLLSGLAEVGATRGDRVWFDGIGSCKQVQDLEFWFFDVRAHIGCCEEKEEKEEREEEEEYNRDQCHSLTTPS